MIDWGLYNGTGRCFAAAFERLYEAANAQADASALPEVLELPPGTFTFHRAPQMRPRGMVILHGPATRFETRYEVHQEKQKTAHGWGIVAPDPKLVEVN